MTHHIHTTHPYTQHNTCTQHTLLPPSVTHTTDPHSLHTHSPTHPHTTGGGVDVSLLWECTPLLVPARWAVHALGIGEAVNLNSPIGRVCRTGHMLFYSGMHMWVVEWWGVLLHVDTPPPCGTTPPPLPPSRRRGKCCRTLSLLCRCMLPWPSALHVGVGRGACTLGD